MPTWPDWLKNADDVSASEFRARWQGSCAPEFLIDGESHLVADLYLHANMQLHADLLHLSHVNVVRHGEIAIQDLLLRLMAVVTDYTSAAIDFSFLDRPASTTSSTAPASSASAAFAPSTRSCPARSCRPAPS